MNFFDYLGISKERFVEDYLLTGLISESIHKEFPLNLFTYSRETVHENKWDNVTSKCRGIIVHRETAEIIARPFEKFHNYGSTFYGGNIDRGEPWVIEKMDGFMCTMYRWNGKNYIASKGSFHSIHAKWATAELNRHLTAKGYGDSEIYAGHTLVFEGLQRDLRVVVDYGKREGLVLLAIINNETGEEKTPLQIRATNVADFMTPTIYPLSLSEAIQFSVQVRKDGIEEGYVLTWYQDGTTPFRLKVKFTEYLRLHRLVTGVSPKRIWEAISQAHLKADLDEYLTASTPWFTKFVNKWISAMQLEFKRLEGGAHKLYEVVSDRIKPTTDAFVRGEIGMGELRKAWAVEFTKPENQEFTGILFAMLDGKDVSEVIWKRVKTLTSNGRPMVDIHTT